MTTIKYWVISAISLMLSVQVCALEMGDSLKSLTIKSTPVGFEYKLTGKPQLILIYPIALSSRSSGKFNHRVIQAGFCPKSIVDMQNRAWYAPLSLAEKELASQVEDSPNPACTVTADYDGIANRHWGLEEGPTTIVADENGKIVFIKYGALSEDEQLRVLDLLGKNTVNK